jgi:hypothetical protein
LHGLLVGHLNFIGANAAVWRGIAEVGVAMAVASYIIASYIVAAYVARLLFVVVDFDFFPSMSASHRPSSLSNSKSAQAL